MDRIKVKVSRNGARKFFTMYFDDPVTRKREQRSTKQTTRKLALKAAGAWEAEINAGNYRKTTRVDWDGFRERYETERLSKLSIRTASAFASAANHLERVINPTSLAHVTSEALQRLQEDLAARTKEIPGESPGDPPRKVRAVGDVAIATHLRHILASLSWAVEKGMLAKVPKVEMPEVHREDACGGRPLTLEELERMIAVVPKVRQDDAPQWVRYLWGLWLTGLRLDESLRASWDEDAPFRLDVSGAHPRWVIRASSQKSRKAAIVATIPEFEDFILQTPEAERHGPLFPLGVTANHAGRIVSRIGRLAGVVIDKESNSFATAHDLRRSFATRLAMTVAPAVLRSLMRHASISTTMGFYVGLAADDVAAELWRKREESQTVRTFVRTGPDSSTGSASKKPQTLSDSRLTECPLMDSNHQPSD